MIKSLDKNLKSKEGRTRQATMAFRPSIFEAIQKAAYVNKSSTTNFIEGLMEQYLNEHPEVIKKYDELSGNYSVK